MKTSTIFIIVIAILVILGGWYAYAMYYAPSSATSATSSTSDNASLSANVNSAVGTTTMAATTTAPMSATVTLTANGFTPSSVTIKQGGTVTFVNQAGRPMWVASDPHPAHTGYDGTSRTQHCAAGYTGAAPFDECSTATTYSFTFQKVGTWGYHNHIGDADMATIIVVQ